MPYEEYNFTVSVVYSSTEQYASHSMTGKTKEGSESLDLLQSIIDVVTYVDVVQSF